MKIITTRRIVSVITNDVKTKNVKKVSCLVRTIDDFAREKNCTVDLIKCDVEGAELSVFQGGIKTIEKDIGEEAPKPLPRQKLKNIKLKKK